MSIKIVAKDCSWCTSAGYGSTLKGRIMIRRGEKGRGKVVFSFYWEGRPETADKARDFFLAKMGWHYNPEDFDDVSLYASE